MCHRHPEKFIRPREQVFNMEWQPPRDQETLGRRLVKQYQIQEARSLTTCSTCHFYTLVVVSNSSLSMPLLSLDSDIPSAFKSEKTCNKCQ